MFCCKLKNLSYIELILCNRNNLCDIYCCWLKSLTFYQGFNLTITKIKLIYLLLEFGIYLISNIKQYSFNYFDYDYNIEKTTYWLHGCGSV